MRSLGDLGGRIGVTESTNRCLRLGKTHHPSHCDGINRNWSVKVSITSSVMPLYGFLTQFGLYQGTFVSLSNSEFFSCSLVKRRRNTRAERSRSTAHFCEVNALNHSERCDVVLARLQSDAVDHPPCITSRSVILFASLVDESKS